MQRGRSNLLVAWSAALAACLLCGACSHLPFRNQQYYLSRAQRYMQHHQTRDAVIEYRKALQRDPRFLPALTGLAHADLALQDWTGAYNALIAAVNLAPERLDLHLLLGRLYLTTRDNADAENEARFVLKRKPADSTGLALLGAALLAQGHKSAAEAAFAKLVAASPQGASAEVNLAVVQIGRGELAAAERSLRSAIARDGHCVAAYTNLAKLYHLQHDATQELATYQEGVQQNPQSADLGLAWAEALYRDGQPQAGAAALTRLQAAHPSDAKLALAIAGWHQDWGEFQPAIAAYEMGLRAAPGNLDLEHGLVSAYLDAGDSAQARQWNARILRQASDDSQARVVEARLKLAAGHTQDAIDELQSVIASDPQSAPARTALGEAYIQTGATQLARQELQKALAEAPNSTEILRALSRFELSQGNTRVAEQYAGRAVAIAPSDAQNRLALGAAYLAEKDWVHAKQQFLAAKSLTPAAAPVYVRLGDVAAATHDASAAAADYEQALKIAPNDDNALSRLADLELGAGRPRQAIARVQAYLAAHPNDAGALTILGGVLLADKQYAAAEAALRHALGSDPRLVLAHLQLARVYQAQGQPAQALQSFQRALALKPDFAPLAAMIGNLYLQQGRLDMAKSFYQQALASDPNFAIAAGNLAWVDLQQNQDLQTALSLAEKAKQLMPRTDSITDTLALAYYKNGAYSNAVPLLRQCIDHEPRQPLYHYHLGLVLAAQGDKATARQQLTAALHMNLQGQAAQNASALIAKMR